MKKRIQAVLSVFKNKINSIPAVAVRRTRESQPYIRKWLRYPIKALGYGNGCSQAFTLIELLVVVLIIGILAAIAVPQYQKAVEKAKATQALVMLKTVIQAMDDYYLANGEYTTSFNNLAINIPFTGTTKFTPVSQDSRSNDEWIIELENAPSGYFSLFMVRKSGQYKGAGFIISLKNLDGIVLNKRIYCMERKKDANYLFDASLPEGAYCEKIIGASFELENEWTRKYSLR